MQKRTNLAVGLGAALYFLPHVNSKVIFFIVVLISSLLPDARQILSLRRGSLRYANSESPPFLDKIMKNYLTAIIVAIFFALFYPIFALPFFVGYSFTLLLNAFSRDGLMLFWPLSRKRINGRVATGGTIDTTIFYIFLLADAALLLKLIFVS